MIKVILISVAMFFATYFSCQYYWADDIDGINKNTIPFVGKAEVTSHENSLFGDYTNISVIGMNKYKTIWGRIGFIGDTVIVQSYDMVNFKLK